MKNRVILLSLVTWLCQISVWAQLEVDSLGRTIIHKELKLSGEEGSLRQSLFGKEGDFYWSEGFGGLKMTSLGKFFLEAAEAGSNIFNTEVDYGFDPPYESIYPQHYHAALTVRSGGSRSIHSIYTGAEGGTHEGIRSDVYENTDRPFAAYVVATTPDSYRTSMQVFSVDGNGLVYGLSGFTQASDGRLKQDVKEIVSGMDRISALRGVSFRYKPGEEQPVSAVANENGHAGYASSDIKRQIEAENARERIGFIAQEVESVVPEVVRTLPDGTKTVMYTDLIPLLVEGMKEMQATIERQEERIAELEESLSGDNVPEKVVPKNARDSEDSEIESSTGEAAIYQNVPNPFSQTTEIIYRLSTNARSASICICDLTGKQLKSYTLQPDMPTGKIVIPASDLTAGMYLYALVIDGTLVDSKRMIVE